MRPGIFWKRANGEKKSIHFIVERSHVVRNRDADITRASGLNNIALYARAFDCHLLC